MDVLLSLNGKGTSLIFDGTYSNEGSTVFILESIDRMTVGKFEPYLLSTNSKTTSSSNEIVVSDLNMPYNLFLMGVGAFNHTEESFKGIYNEGIRFLSLENQKFEKPSSGVIYYNHDLYDEFDVITLNGTFESRKGNKPISYTYTDKSFRVDKTKLFKLDETLVYKDSQLSHKIRKHVYGSYNGLSNLTPGNKAKLVYDLGLREEGSIIIKIKPDSLEGSGNRYIISSQNGNTVKLGLAINNLNQLMLIYNGNTYNSELVIEENKWQTVGLRYTPGQIIINCNKSTKTYNYTVDLTGCLTSIGMKILSEVPCEHLIGVMEMLSYTKQLISNTTLDKIIEEGEAIIARKTYDVLGRVDSKEILIGDKQIKTEYEYEKTSSGNLTTTLNKEIQNDGTVITYQYDSCNNITQKKVTKDEVILEIYEYQYDFLSRLKLEKFFEKGLFKYHREYKYDNNNNIKTIIQKDLEGNTIKESVYNYITENNNICDRLTSIEDITYDSSGNETKSINSIFEYNDSITGNPSKIIENGNELNLTWQGRRLLSINDITYKYNDAGIRISKTSPTENKQFILNGSSIIQMKDLNDSSKDIFFNYDEVGLLLGFTLREEEYFYTRDITGNIQNVIDTNGNILVKYNYDAWGTVTKTNIANTDESALVMEVNPFLYKGYFYDEETGLYYNVTRYYNPEWGRFLNADDVSYLDPESINGLNLFTYCGNNPIMRIDPYGNAWWNPFSWSADTWGAIGSAILVGASVVGLGALAVATGGLGGVAIMAVASGMGFGAGIGAVSAISSGTSVTAGILSGAIKGGATGAAVGLGIMTGGGAFTAMGGLAAFGGAVALNFGAGMLSYTIDNGLNGRGLTWKDALGSGSMQALTGAFAFGAGAVIGQTGFYNIPGQSRLLSSQWIGNFAAGQFFKGLMLYPFSFTFSLLQKNNFSGRL